MVAHLEIGT